MRGYYTRWRAKLAFDPEDISILERCVHEAESRTQAELVLVVRGASGNYRDIEWLFGAAMAFALLLVDLFSPYDVTPAETVAGVLPLFFLAAWICRKTPLRRWLTHVRRQVAQVRHAALSLFHEKKVDRTRGRSGVLVYFSVLERLGEIVVDPGLAPEFPPERMKTFRLALEAACEGREPVLALGEMIRTLGVYLGQVRPLDGVSERENELEDRPDLRSSAEAD